jgi:hypothetical protein
VALIGDSHAAQWEPALARIAAQRHWTIDLYLKTNCAVTDARRSAAYDACATWSASLLRRLGSGTPYPLIITSFFAENLNLEVDARRLSTAQATAGFRDAWAPLIAAGSRIVVIADTPHMLPSTTVCVALHGASTQCEVPRAQALARPDLQVEAARGLTGAAVVDMSDWLCSATECPAVVGGVALHTDPYHLTATYSRTTAPYLDAELQAAINDRPGVGGQ